MPTPIDDLICTACSRRVSGSPQGAAFGFRTFACPKCRATVKYPLSDARRGLYWLLIVVKLMLCLAMMLNGSFPIPVFGILVFAWVIAENASIHRNLSEAQRRLRHETQGVIADAR